MSLKQKLHTLKEQYRGTKMAPVFNAFHTFTSYLAYVDEIKCKGCGICVEKCPIEAIELEGELSVTNNDKCIGCGICSHHCPA